MEDSAAGPDRSCSRDTVQLLQRRGRRTARPGRVVGLLVQCIPLGRIGRPDDIAAAIEFLSSPDAGYITGQSLHVSGGLKM
ncbi:MAG: SDR family oxidoreductase [Rhizobiales bacterium]|nr:SDR family oxidoreductase [Hyphomicrobiales bacterium]